MALARLRVCVHRFILICSCFFLIFLNFSSTAFLPAHQHFGQRSQLGGCVFFGSGICTRQKPLLSWLAGRVAGPLCSPKAAVQSGSSDTSQRSYTVFFFSKNWKRLPDLLAFALPLRLGRQPTHCDVTKGTSICLFLCTKVQSKSQSSRRKSKLEATNQVSMTRRMRTGPMVL